jgi:hypothetical protein
MNPIFNIPLGVHQSYDPESDSTLLSWSYIDSDEITHFEIEYYDENLRKWVKFDGRNGIVPKQPKRGE